MAVQDTQLNDKTGFQEGNFQSFLGILAGSQCEQDCRTWEGPGELINQGQFPRRARMIRCKVQKVDEQTWISSNMNRKGTGGGSSDRPLGRPGHVPWVYTDGVAQVKAYLEIKVSSVMKTHTKTLFHICWQTSKIWVPQLMCAGDLEPKDMPRVADSTKFGKKKNINIVLLFSRFILFIVKLLMEYLISDCLSPEFFNWLKAFRSIQNGSIVLWVSLFSLLLTDSNPSLPPLNWLTGF